MEFKKIKTLIVLGIVLLLSLVVLGQSCTAVKSTQRGVKVRFGEVQETKVVKSGLNFKMPFIEKIDKYSIEPNQLNMVIEPAVNGALTKDNQTIGLTMRIVWKYDEDKIVDIAKNYSEKKLIVIIETLTESSSKSVVGMYDIFSLAEKQEVLSKDIKNLMLQKVKENGYPLVIVDVQTTNFDWSDDFDRSIALTMNMAQEVKQSTQEYEKSKIISQKQVVEAEAAKAAQISLAEGKRESAIANAEGEKASMIAKAEGELRVAELNAEAKKLDGDAIKYYNESIKSNIEVEIQLRNLEIEKTRVARWNGVYVPNNMYGPIPVNTAGGVKGY